MQDNKRHNEIEGSLVELRDLLDDLAAGKLSEEQDIRLQHLAVESEAAKRLYLQYMDMYGTIHRKLCNRDKFQASLPLSADPPDSKTTSEHTTSSNSSIFPLLEMENDILSSFNSTTMEEESVNPTTRANIFGWINFSQIPMLVIIVAVTLVLSAFVVLPIYWATRPADPQWAVVARITRTTNCQWNQGEKWLQDGSFLTAGQLLDLKAGLAEVEFASGAVVVLQGPSRFIISNRNDSRLDQGQLFAHVTEEAKGFRVRTPGMDLVDLGTEFGVSVELNHKSDLHVFKGLVEMEAATKHGKTKTIRLKENEAVRYDISSGEVVPIPIDNKKFVSDLDEYKDTQDLNETKEEIAIRLRVTSSSGAVSSENVVGPGINPNHFGSVIYKTEDGPIRITGTISNRNVNANSNWQGLWAGVSLTPTHFFDLNGNTVAGYTHLGDNNYGSDGSRQTGLGALGMTFCKQGENVQAFLEDYASSQSKHAKAGFALIDGVKLEDHSTHNPPRLAWHLLDKDSNTFTPAGTSADPTAGTLKASERGWMTSNDDSEPYIIFDLGAEYNSVNMRIWNWNQAGGGGEFGFAGAGVKTANVFFAGPSKSFLSSTSITVPIASGKDGYEGTLFSFSQAGIRYIKLVPTSNYFTDAYSGTRWENETGISKVQFSHATAVDKSSAMAVDQTKVGDTKAIDNNSYPFEIIYDFKAKTVSGSFNGSKFISRDISSALDESNSFLLQIFTKPIAL